jgi:hypothetical protein
VDAGASQKRLNAELAEALSAQEPFQISHVDLIGRTFGESTTQVGRQLASTWIRNASGYVFSRPHRWIVEAALNGSDANSPDGATIGMFGMGFLSTLSVLPESGPGPHIDVLTRSAKGNLRITLTGPRSDPGVTYAALAEDQPPKHRGTIVRIEPHQGESFPPSRLEGLEEEVSSLQFFRKAAVFIQVEGGPPRQVNPGRTAPGAPRVDIRIGAKRIEIEDHGSGITPEVALTRFLVPSASTKTPAARGPDEQGPSKPPELVDRPGKERSTVMVGVEGVVLSELELDPSLTAALGSPAHLLIDLPPWVKFTLDRTEVVFDERGGSPEEQQLRSAIDSAVATDLSPGQKQRPQSLRLNLLYAGLRAMEEQSESRRVASGVFSSHLKDVVREALSHDASLVPLPIEHAAALEKLMGALGARRPRPVPVDPAMVDFDFGRIEEVLEKQALATVEELKGPVRDIARACARGGCIDGTSIFFVPDDALPKTRRGTAIASSLGMRNMLFVPRSLLEEVGNPRDTSAAVSQLARRIIYRNIGSRGELQPASGRGDDGSMRGQLRSGALVTNAESLWPHSGTRETALWGDIRPGTKESALAWAAVRPTRGAIEHLWKEQPVLGAFDRGELLQLWHEYAGTVSESQDRLPQFRSSYRWFERNQEELARLLEDAVGTAVFRREPRPAWQARPDDADPNPIYEKDRGLRYILGPDRELNTLDVDALAALAIDIAESEEGKAWNGMRYSENREKIAEVRARAEAALGAHPELLIREDPIPFLNFLVVHLLAAHGQISSEPLLRAIAADGGEDAERFEKLADQVADVPQDRFLSLGDQILWPLPKDADIDDLRRLIGGLLLNYRQRGTVPIGGDDADPTLRSLYESPLDVPPLAGTSITRADAAPLREKLSELAFTIQAERRLDRSKFSPDYGLNFLQRVKDGVQAIYLARTRPGIDPLAAEQLERLEQATLYLYNRYFDIPHEEFVLPYGHGKARLFNTKLNDGVSPATAERALSTLSASPGGLQKLVRLQIDELAYRLDPKRRKQDLARRQVLVPHLPDTSVTGQLGRLLEQGVPPELVTRMVENANDFRELAYFAAIVDAAIDQHRKLGVAGRSPFTVEDKDERARVGSATRIFLEDIIQRRLDPGDIRDWFETHRVAPAQLLPSKEFKEPLTKLEGLGRELLNFARSALAGGLPVDVQQDASPPQAKKALQDAHWVSVKQLIRAHASDDGLATRLASGDLSGALKRIEGQPADLDLGKITQDVEHGSERDAARTIFVEATQNALDEIRGFEKLKKKGAKEIAETLKARAAAGLDPDELKGLTLSVGLEAPGELVEGAIARTVLSIDDPVGVKNLSVLLTDFLLPDLSNKDPEGDTAGMLGNGAFQMYQDAAVLRFTTRFRDDPSRAVTLEVEPVREDDRVVDLKFRVAEVPDLIKTEPKFFGSRVQVVLRERPWEESVNAAVYGRVFARDVIGTATAFTPEGAPIPIELQDRGETERLNRPQHRSELALASREFGEQGREVTVLRSDSRHAASRLNTTGIPVSRLQPVLEAMRLLPPNLLSEASSGLTVDLPKGSYAPVKSRTKLRWNPGVEEPLRRTLLDAIYGRGFKDGGDSSLERLFQHRGSRTELSQVMVSPREEHLDTLRALAVEGEDMPLNEFFTHYRPTLLEGSRTPSFAHWIEDGYRTLVSRRINPVRERLAQDVAKLRASIPERIAEGGDRAVLSMRYELLRMRGDAVDEIQKAYDSWRKEARSDDAIRRQFSGRIEGLPPDQVEAVRAYFDALIAPWFEEKLAALDLAVPPDDEELSRIFPELMTAEERNALEQARRQIVLAANGHNHRPATEASGETAAADSPNSPGLDTLREVCTMTEDVLTSYARQQLENAGAPLPDLRVRLARLDLQTMGRFNPGTTEIEINIGAEACSLPRLFELMSALGSGDLITTERTAKALLIPQLGAAGLIPHEDLHAHPNGPTGTDAHAPRLGADGRVVDFEAAATSYAAEAAQDGVFERWVEEARGRLSTPEARADLSFATELLAKLEADDLAGALDRLLV